MKNRSDVIKALLNGAKDQPAGKYVEVLAEDLVIALTPQADPPATNDEQQ